MATDQTARPGPRVYTVGHGTRSLEELVAVLRSAGVEVLVDVRRFASSRRNPQFSHDSLEHAMGAAGISYLWRGEGLGGRRSGTQDSRHVALHNESFRAYADYMDTGDFREALEELEGLARGSVAAIMCAETVWWRCHRRHIADALTLHGFEVIHLMTDRDHQPYVPHPVMRADESGRPVYDVGETGSLL